MLEAQAVCLMRNTRRRRALLFIVGTEAVLTGMFSLVVLFSVFLGLVGILGLYGECRRRRREHARTHDTHANLAWLQAWLDDKGHSVPSVAMVIGLLNRFAKRELQSEDWQELQLSGLLPTTELPHFSVRKIEQQTSQHIEFQVGIEWPMCLPGVGVKLVRKVEEEEGEGEEVMCELQVDWMYAEATIRLTDSSHGLLLGYKHTLTPQMALSCMVTTQGVIRSEELASSVAHALQLMFYQLELTSERLWAEDGESSDLPHGLLQDVFTTTPALSMNHNHTPHPGHQDKSNQSHSKSSSLDSNVTLSSTAYSSTSQLGVEGEEEGEVVRMGEGGEGRSGGGERVRQVEVSVQNGFDQVSSPVSHKLWAREGISDTGESGEDGGDVRSEKDSVGAVKNPNSEGDGVEALPPAATPPGTPMFVITPITEPPPPNTAHKHSSPPSPLTTHKHSSPTHASQCSYSTLSWRRTPSYEKLQEFTLPSVQEGSVATRMSGDRQEDGYEVAPMFSVGLDRRQTQSMVTMRRRGEGEEFALSPMSLDQRRRQTLSMSGSAYSTESGDEEMYPSTLVFEISDSARMRHIVALSKAHASKLRKRVTHAHKLHIYNNHIFVATHLKQRFYCHACKKKIAGFMGKQGYACRDCNMVVHKQCHCKVEGLCTNSKLPSMNLIYPESVSTISEL